MVSPASTPRTARALVTLILVLAAGCADHEPPSTGPIPSASALEDFADVVGTVQHEYLDANAPVFRSLEVLGPYLQGVLTSWPGTVSTGDLVMPCVSPALQGRTFVFDGSRYVPADLPGAPVAGVRFLLYAVNDQGAPDLDASMGHLEIRCLAGPSGLDLQVSVVAQGVEVFGVAAAGSYPDPIDVRLSGVERTPDGRSGWSWGGGLLGNGYFYTARLPGDVTAFYTILDQSGTTPDNVLVQIRKENPELDWEIYADILAGAGGEILEGPVRLTTREGSRLAACMSASIEMPAVSSPELGGCGTPSLPALSPSTDELRVLESGYVVLRTLYLIAGDLVATGLTAVGPAP